MFIQPTRAHRFCDVAVLSLDLQRDPARMNYLTTDQLADKLGISPQRVKQLAAQGRITGTHRIGRAWAFTEGARVLLAPRTKRMLAKQRQSNRERKTSDTR